MRSRRVWLVLITVMLCLPIVIFEVANTPMPPVLAAIVVSVPFFLISSARQEKWCLIGAISLSVISIGVVSIFISQTVSLRPFFSLFYFFGPGLLFFTGYQLIRRPKDLRFFVSLLATIAVIVLAAIAIGLIVNDISVRILYRDGDTWKSKLAGSFLGLQLYAAEGVNTLAVFYATMSAIIILRFISWRQKWHRRRWYFGAGILFSFYLVFGSGSREALLGLAVFIALIGPRVMSDHLGSFRGRRRSHLLVTSLVMLAVILSFVGLIQSWDTIVSIVGEGLFTGSRIQSTVDALVAKDWSMLTSNRTVLWGLALEDIAKNPLFGNGFYGFQLYGIQRGIYDSVVGKSAHNHYLTSVWKMGFIPAIFYFSFLFLAVRKAYRLQKITSDRLHRGLWSLLWVYFFVLAMLWDVFMVPLLGSFIFFLLGGMARLYDDMRILPQRTKAAVDISTRN